MRIIYIVHVHVHVSFASQRLLKFSISWFWQIQLKHKFSWIKFLWSSFQPCLACILNFKFCRGKFLQPFSDLQNRRNFSALNIFSYTVFLLHSVIIETIQAIVMYALLTCKGIVPCYIRADCLLMNPHVPTRQMKTGRGRYICTCS